MIRTEKLGRKVSSSAKVKKLETKRVSPMNPLCDLNFPSIPPLQASAEAQRRGCFRFCRPNSSTKADSFLRSQCQPRTPKSAPPSSRNLSSKAIPSTSSFRNKNRPKPICENPQNLRLKKPAKPNTPDLLHKSKKRRPVMTAHTGVTKPESNFKMDFKAKNVFLVDSAREIAKPEPICKMNSTRERAITPEGIKPVSEGKPQLSATPPSNSTPPIQASISPEVSCAFSVTPTPVCFATGHVMAGVEDRRKCRPRGILTIGEQQDNLSRVSSAPPLVEASVCWFSSPLEVRNGSGGDSSCSKVRTFDFPDEASVNWLKSPRDVAQIEIESGLVKTKSSILDAGFGVEETPSSYTGILRTPSSGSVSPFSVIVQRAEASSRPQVLSTRKEIGGYRYGNALDVSPSEEAWSNSGAVSTPSYTNSKRNGVISLLEIDSATEDLGALRLSSKPVSGNNQSDISPMHSLSFKFGCQPTPTPLNSIDLNCFKRSRCDDHSEVEKRENLLASGARISWRDGLLSRIFEMGELDSYHSFFDVDKDVDYQKDGDAKSDFGFKFALENGSLSVEKGNGFGSYEFPVGKNKIVHKCPSKVPLLEPISFAESISIEDGLVSSGDSDWTLFYKNNLFEV
ncbi:uncharacterized protein LOC110034715 [Phalaenopsis equestris]|uniref:uncharacterized protein LOC110034715 n=1 Tax=Phalaenopsis equestris TaxID=78828 RepID=UPI0009E305E8|nr:uncharacterized protein LOC110034715 [Phalaenopsis equestris]